MSLIKYIYWKLENKSGKMWEFVRDYLYSTKTGRRIYVLKMRQRGRHIWLLWSRCRRGLKEGFAQESGKLAAQDIVFQHIWINRVWNMVLDVMGQNLHGNKVRWTVSLRRRGSVMPTALVLKFHTEVESTWQVPLQGTVTEYSHLLPLWLNLQIS